MSRRRYALLFVGAALMAGAAGPAFAQVDLTGMWGQRMHVDQPERGPGPEYGDYLGLPLNAAALARAEAWSDQKWSVPEHQCEPHPADYAPNGPAHLRIWADVDPYSQEMVALRTTMHWMVAPRVIWLDNRPRPSELAAHTWGGFSLGRWMGDLLAVETTHLKEGWVRRNGVARSDRGRLTEYWARHDDVLTVVSIVEDPVYLTEPMVRTWNWELDVGYAHAPYPCSARVEIQRERGFVAHWLPGENPLLDEFRAELGVPTETARGGAATMYPEYQKKLRSLSRR